MASSLVIPAALRKTILPRRSIPGSAIAPTEAVARKTLQHIAAVVRKPKQGGDKTNAAIFAAGLAAQKEPELAALRILAHALLSELSLDALRGAEIDVLAAAGRMIASVSLDLSFVSAIAFARGAEDALHVTTRETFFGTAAEGGYTTAVFLVTAKDCPWWMTTSWNRLRHAICAAPEDEYERLRETGRALRGEVDIRRKSWIAYAFPDEPWGAQDIQSSDFDHLLTAMTDADAVSAHVAARGPFCVSLYALDLALGLSEERALPILADALAKLLVKTGREPIGKTAPRDVARAIACYRSEEAAAILAPYATNAILGALVLQYFRDAPELGAVLEAQAKGRDKLRETVERVLGKKSGREENATIADDAAIPKVLRERSWRTARNGGRAETILTLERLEEGVGQVLISTPPPALVPYMDALIRDMTGSDLEAWRTRVNAREYAQADYEFRRVSAPGNGWEYMRVPDTESVWAWNQGHVTLTGGPRLFVARHGLKALPGFFARKWIDALAYEGGEEMMQAAMYLVVPAMAASIARVAARRKRFRRVALAWLLEHAEVTALGLIHDALGAIGDARSDAEAALVYLMQRGEAEVVNRSSKRYGEVAEHAIAELFARDPMAMGARAPKPPSFLRASDLPRVRLSSGQALSDDAQAALLEMLQIASLDMPYPGVALVREACDAASLGDLARELTEQWVLGEAPGRHDWMLFSTVHFPSDAGTRRVAALAREWARKDRNKGERASIALASIGTDLALLHLSHIADTTRFDALRKLTRELIAEAAEARGLTIDELGDLTVPDLGLEADGTIQLSYGARAFVVSLDETLRPFVRETMGEDATGERMTTPPRPKKTDDTAAAKDARARFDAFAADLESVAQRQLHRLERAMSDGRSWPFADFRSRIVTHPLLIHIARRLVWEATDPRDAPTTFRIAEDGTFADEGDRPIRVRDDASIRIAHPARNIGISMAWTRCFSDYEILQPFEQLGRALTAMTPSEAKATQLARTEGLVAQGKKVLGVLESRGWSRNDSGHVTSYTRAARATDGSTLVARLPISPGIEMQTIADGPDQTTGALSLEGDIAIGALDRVAFSEIVRDVEALRGA